MQPFTVDRVPGNVLTIDTNATYQHRSGHLVIRMETNRQPQTVILVIDASGQMGTSGNYRDIRNSIRGITETLFDTDLLAIVEYNDVATVRWPLQTVRKFKENMLQWVLRPPYRKGGSNLGTGIREAVALLKKVPPTTRVREVGKKKQGCEVDTAFSHLIVMSPGHPSRGITDRPTLTKYIQGVTLAIPHTQIHAIGYGVDCNAELLQSLTKLGGGKYVRYSSRMELSGWLQCYVLKTKQPLYSEMAIQIVPEENTVVNQTTIDVGSVFHGKPREWHVLFTPKPDTEFASPSKVLTIEIDYVDDRDFLWHQSHHPIVL